MNNPTLSVKRILLQHLNKSNLNAFYDGLPYRYNSITDLILQQEERIKQELLERVKLADQLFYKVYLLSQYTSSLPILECLEIEGASGGMLSTYLHDLDRRILEGSDDVPVRSKSLPTWKMLLKHTEFSFVFRASHNPDSRTRRYMRQIGFKEKHFCDNNLWCFFNGANKNKPFMEVMQELALAIEHKNKFYSFDREMFKAAKIEQAKIARNFLLMKQ